jgi:hypothetical protein
LYFLFNKMRDKGKTASAWKRGGGGEREGVGEGVGGGGEMTQTLYAHMNKGNKKNGYRWEVKKERRKKNGG